MTTKPTEARQDELAGIRENFKKICCKQCDMLMEGEPCYVDKSACDIRNTIPDEYFSLTVSSGGRVCPRCSRFGDSKGSICMYHKDRKPYWSKCPTCNGTGQKQPKTLAQLVKEHQEGEALKRNTVADPEPGME